MRNINVYFGAVTKVSLGHVVIPDDQSIEETITTWAKQGFAKVHTQNNSLFIYIPWSNVIYCQYASNADSRDV